MMIKSLTRGRGCVCLLVAAAVEDAVKMKMVKYTHQSCCFQRGEHVRSEQAKRAGGASGDDDDGGDERNFLETARLLLLLLLLLLFCSGTFALSPTKRRG